MTTETTTPKLPSPVDRLRKRPAATATYTFTFDPADLEAVTNAENAVETTRRTAEKQPKSPTAKNAHTAAKKKLRKVLADTVLVTVTVRAIGASLLERIQHEHPPTEQQIATAEGKLDDGQQLLYDPDTYGPAILAESLVRLEFSDDPDGAVTRINVEEAHVLWEQVAQLDRLEMLTMISAINMRSSKVDLVGKG